MSHPPALTATALLLALGVTALPLANVAEAGGLPTGKRQHKPFVVTKPVDKASAFEQMIMADVDPPAGEAESVLVITQSQAEEASASGGGGGAGKVQFGRIALKRGIDSIAWRFEVDGVATCKLADGTLSDAAGHALLVQSGDLVFVPGARKARYARTANGVIDADGTVIAVTYDDQTERHPLELITLAATLDGFCR